MKTSLNKLLNYLLILVVNISSVSHGGDYERKTICRVISENIGVEVLGMDLSSGILPDEIDLIRSLLSKHLVVVIKNQNLSAKQQADITNAFGDIEASWKNKHRHEDERYAYLINHEILKEKPDFKSPTFYWHWDKSWVRYPTAVSFAFFPSEPQPKGVGMTIFSNMYAAYDELPEDIKSIIKNLYVIHSYDYMNTIKKADYERVSLNFEKGEEIFPDVIHPIVRVHPITNRQTLNVDELYQSKILALSELEGIKLRKTLLEHATQEKYLYYHAWEKGDFVLWDNLALLHRAMPSDPSISRVLQRTSISSRKYYEGRCILIGMEDGLADLNTDKLFISPLIINTDFYDDLSILENHVQVLRQGDEIKIANSIIPPHAIVILSGIKWKESKIICSQLDIVGIVCEGEKALTQFPRNTQIINLLEKNLDLAQKIEDSCLHKYLLQEDHERMTVCDLSADYLERKEKILTQSSETYRTDKAKEEYATNRLLVHANILCKVFAHSHLNYTSEQWFELIKYPRQHKIYQQKNTDLNTVSWLVFWEKIPTLNDPFAKKLCTNDYIVIDQSIFSDYLFNDIPYEHKEKLWAIINDEKQDLILLMTKIALSNGINVIVHNSHSFSLKNCVQLTNVVKNAGGKSILIAFNTLDLNLEKIQKNSINKDVVNNQIYEEIAFYKEFASKWKEFIKNFHISMLVDLKEKHSIVDVKSLANNVVFFSEKNEGRWDIISLNGMYHFLAKALIDPNKLSNDLIHLIEIGNQSHADEFINSYLDGISPVKSIDNSSCDKIIHENFSKISSNLSCYFSPSLGNLNDKAN